MAENEPSAPTQTDPGAGGGEPAPSDPGTTTTPDPAPSDGGNGDGTQPAAPADGDGTGSGTEPAADPGADKGSEGNEPGNGEGDEPGDEPADDPNKPKEGDEPGDSGVDLTKMSRAERAQYYQNLEANSRKQAEATVNATYQPQSVDELKQKYIDQGHSDFEASMLAREEIRDQEADIAKARAERAELNANLAVEATEVLNTFGWLNPKNKESYDKKSSDAAVDLYDRLCLTRDVNTAETDNQGQPIPGTGQIIGASMTPKEFYTLLDNIRSSGTETARMEAQKAAERQMGSVAAPSSNSNKPVDKSFDQLSNAEKRERLRAQGHLIT